MRRPSGRYLCHPLWFVGRSADAAVVLQGEVVDSIVSQTICLCFRLGDAELRRVCESLLGVVGMRSLSGLRGSKNERLRTVLMVGRSHA